VVVLSFSSLVFSSVCSCFFEGLRMEDLHSQTLFQRFLLNRPNSLRLPRNLNLCEREGCVEF